MSASKCLFPLHMKRIPIEVVVGTVAEAVVGTVAEVVEGSVEGIEEGVVACP